MLIVRSRLNWHTLILPEVVSCALGGSEYAIEAWKICETCLVGDRRPTVTELSKIEDLLDRAKDDLKGASLRVDLELGKIYA